MIHSVFIFSWDSNKNVALCFLFCFVLIFETGSLCRPDWPYTLRHHLSHFPSAEINCLWHHACFFPVSILMFHSSTVINEKAIFPIIHLGIIHWELILSVRALNLGFLLCSTGLHIYLYLSSFVHLIISFEIWRWMLSKNCLKSAVGLPQGLCIYVLKFSILAFPFENNLLILNHPTRKVPCTLRTQLFPLLIIVMRAHCWYKSALDSDVPGFHSSSFLYSKAQFKGLGYTCVYHCVYPGFFVLWQVFRNFLILVSLRVLWSNKGIFLRVLQFELEKCSWSNGNCWLCEGRPQR